MGNKHKFGYLSLRFLTQAYWLPSFSKLNFNSSKKLRNPILVLTLNKPTATEKSNHSQYGTKKTNKINNKKYNKEQKTKITGPI